MTDAFLLGRAVLGFAGGTVGDGDDVRDDLSALAIDGDANLWTASDEATGVVRLEPAERGTFRRAAYVDLAHPLDLVPESTPAKKADEMDIEGMDVDGALLWFTGSHTSTRKKAKGKSTKKDLDRLAKVVRRRNRYIIGRMTLTGGDAAGEVARLPLSDAGNPLTEALLPDRHLGPFLTLPGPADTSIQLASKENGFDIEGLAARHGRLFLGLRGPVLRGWAAILLEIEPQEVADNTLGLASIGAGGRPYRKHFVDLEGMGIRDLCWQGTDLLILAGPTMDVAGLQTLWRFRDAAGLDDDSVTGAGDNALERVFDLPVRRDSDKAEGMALYDGHGEPGLLVVYDSPHAERKRADGAVLGDVFRLPTAR